MSKDPDSSKKTLVLPDALIGKKIAGYEIRGLLGKGGMGVVYRAYDPSLDREVALKVLPPALCSDADYAERFLREARVAGKLDHPRIVPVYAAGTVETGAWIAMQLVRGRTLAEEMQDGMRPTFANVVKVARQTAEALGAAHAAGLVHRDIKPGNIIIDTAGDAKVLDFGLARPTMSSGYTQEGTYLGTPEYSSPEQCQSNDVDGRADLYSLGVVMYEMLGGRIPHVAETPLALFTKIVNEDPIPLRTLNPSVPLSLAAIVARLLARNRDARYANAAALISDLDKVIIREGAPSGETRVIGPADRARVAAWTLAGVLATLLVAALIHGGPGSGQATGQGTGTVVAGGTPVVDGWTPQSAINRIVFLDFKNMTSDEPCRWMESGLPEMLASTLATQDGFDPVEREAVIEAMRKEFGARLTSGGSDDPAAAQAQGIKLLRSLNATVLVRGWFVVTGDTIRVSTMALAIRGEKLVLVARYQQDGRIQDILTLADGAAGTIAEALRPARDKEKQDGDKPREYLRKAGEEAQQEGGQKVGLVAARRSLAERYERRHRWEGKSQDQVTKGDAPGELAPAKTGKEVKKNEDLKHKDDKPQPPVAQPPAPDMGAGRDNSANHDGRPDADPKNPDDGVLEGDDKQEQQLKILEKKLADDEVLALETLRKFCEDRRRAESDLPVRELGEEGANTK